MSRSDFSFFVPLRARYSEVDAQGVVYTSHYLTYYDIAITEYMRRFGHLSDLNKVKSGVDVHTVKATVEWKAPILVDEEVDVCIRVSRIGRSSMTFTGEIHRKGEDRAVNLGEVIWVNTDQKARKAVPFDADLIARIRAAEGDKLVMG